MKAETRAKALGVSPAKLRRHGARKIARLRAVAEEMAAPWCDVDEGMIVAVDQFLERVSELDAALQEALCQLAEPYGWEGDQ